ncbi:hypothetical protein FO519_008164 [Halicephalobus sp. NKZ332]|nr:hypothetical protein FO519_008164 [Halicephalobus sp. NKZ332]
MKNKHDRLEFFPDQGGLSKRGPYFSNGTEFLPIFPFGDQIYCNYYTPINSTDYGSLRGTVTAGIKDFRLPSNCSYYFSHNNTYIFSNFNMTSGYSSNTHCSQPLSPPENTQYVFRFKTFHLELEFDNVTVENLMEFGPIKLLPGHIYLAPPYDLVIKFDSDSTITQAGFELLVTEISKF